MTRAAPIQRVRRRRAEGEVARQGALILEEKQQARIKRKHEQKPKKHGESGKGPLSVLAGEEDRLAWQTSVSSVLIQRVLQAVPGLPLACSDADASSLRTSIHTTTVPHLRRHHRLSRSATVTDVSKGLQSR